MPTGKGMPLYLKYSPDTFSLQGEDTMRTGQEVGTEVPPLWEAASQHPPRSQSLHWAGFLAEASRTHGGKWLRNLRAAGRASKEVGEGHPLTSGTLAGNFL